jgi:hypothetical protein
MGLDRVRNVLGVVAAGSLVLSSTAAIASAPAPVQQVDPWAALSVLSGGAPAAAMCGSAAAASAQGAGGCVLPVTDAPPPPPAETVPPPAVAAGSAGVSPLFFALAAVIIGVGAYFFTKGGHPNTVVFTPTPISPT